MNDQTAPDLSTMENVVNAGVDVMADAKAKLDASYRAIGKLDDIFEAGGNLGMAGALKVDLMRARLKVAQGHVATARAMMAELHIEGTKVAQENGVDPPQPQSGGGR